jgi:hypothetical protein
VAAPVEANTADQQAIPKAIKAMPATRATSIATPVSSSPNNNWPTSAGTISNANPVAASPAAAKISTFFIALITPSVSRSRPGRRWLKAASASLSGPAHRNLRNRPVLLDYREAIDFDAVPAPPG